MNGGFSPLEGFMTEADYTSYVHYRLHPMDIILTYLLISRVLDTLRLKNGILFSIPVTLDISQQDVDDLSITVGDRIALRDPRNDHALAIISGNTLPPHETNPGSPSSTTQPP